MTYDGIEPSSYVYKDTEERLSGVPGSGKKLTWNIYFTNDDTAQAILMIILDFRKALT